MESAVDRHVFYISDGTAITAEVLGACRDVAIPGRHQQRNPCRLWKTSAARGR